MSSSIEEQIKSIEEEIFNTPKNKSTEHHIGKLKAKLARLREETEKRRSIKEKGRGFSIKKSGDATVGIIGFPNIGKSTLLNQLTDASTKTGDYDFTTLEVIPGMMKYKGADVQLLDFPGLIEGASKGRGRGREILSAIRNVDLVLLMIDAQHINHLEIMEKELYDAGLRLNQKPPDVVLTKKERGGITVNATTTLTYMSENVVKSIASEFVINADLVVREDITEEQLIDFFSQNRVYVSAIVIVNKKDLVGTDVVADLEKTIEQKGWNVVSISAMNGDGLPRLRDEIFSHLRLIRIYMKPVGKKADYNEPLILREGETIGDACRYIHRDFQRGFRYATIWGPSAKHAGQKVGLGHALQDGDVLTIVIEK